MIYSSLNVFCDWADVTCSADESFLTNFYTFLRYHVEWSLAVDDDDKKLYSYDGGTIHITIKPAFHRVSLSGGALAYFRKQGALDEMLFVLSEVPHKVTRLDAALDLPIDGPIFLRKLESAYPKDTMNFSRKALKVTRMYSARETDGQQTGTWYAGHRSSARVTARVYDKIQELVDKRGLYRPSLEERFPRGLTRVELTFRKDFGCTLRDISMPASLFYEYSEPVLVNRPQGVSPWSPTDMVGWAGVAPDRSLTLSRFRYKLEQSPELTRIAQLAAQFGPNGTDVVIRAFRTHIEHALRESEAESAPADR